MSMTTSNTLYSMTTPNRSLNLRSALNVSCHEYAHLISHVYPAYILNAEVQAF